VSLMGVVRRNSAWILATAACWVAVGVFYLHLESLCRENPGCSGEYGIELLPLALPWILVWEHLGIDTSVVLFCGLVFLNSLIVGFVVQLSIRWVRKLCGCSDHRV
jgi:hypothetical protein